MYCAILGLRPPHKKGRLVGYGSAKRKGGKEESRPLRVGSTSRFLRLGKKKADRGEKSALRDGDRVGGRELGGRTDEVYTKVVGEARQAGERNTAAEIVCG